MLTDHALPQAGRENGLQLRQYKGGEENPPNRGM